MEQQVVNWIVEKLELTVRLCNDAEIIPGKFRWR